CATAINLLAKRVRHHHRDPGETDDSRHPTKRQPCAREHRVKSIFSKRPKKNDGREDRYDSAADVPRAREWIILVNVSPDRVRLIAKDKSLRGANLTEVLDRIDTDERAGRTILFARVSLPSCARWVERCVLAEIALDRDRIV